MIEMRWACVPHTTTEPPRLQYRVHTPTVDIGGHLCPGEWSEWIDVPRVIVPEQGEGE